MADFHAPVDDTLFLLNSVFGIDRYNNLPGFEDATPDMIEAILNEGTDYDLSSELSSFFNVWSEATTVLDSGSTLLNQGRTVATYIKNMRSDLLAQRQLHAHDKFCNLL